MIIYFLNFDVNNSKFDSIKTKWSHSDAFHNLAINLPVERDKLSLILSFVRLIYFEPV